MSEDFREQLYTVDKRGHRQWVYSSVVRGFFYTRRKIVAWLLLAFYLAMPWISIGGKQGILLDFTTFRFVFFGMEFWATDTYYLFFVFGIFGFAMFFFTALFGRIWCGWICPETVFLEFVFRPIEQWIEGSPSKRKRLNVQGWNFEKIWKKGLKHSISAVLSWIIASSCLAYFLGREPLFEMMQGSPAEHPYAFTATLLLMGAMAFQFGWFREQFCTVLCPYARFQAVLMDNRSLTVGYDPGRGEPRGKRVHGKTAEGQGDCIDCGLCVQVCPTGIDIRNGSQLECIACTNCIDACDSIMDRMGFAKGLVRYDTELGLLGASEKYRLLRPRTVAYGGLLTVFAFLLVYALSAKPIGDFQVLRGARDKPYTLISVDQVSNHLHLKVSNKSQQIDMYTFAAEEGEGVELITPLTPLSVESGKIVTAPLFVNFPKAHLKNGKKKLVIQINSAQGYSAEREVTLLGPDA